MIIADSQPVFRSQLDNIREVGVVSSVSAGILALAKLSRKWNYQVGASTQAQDFYSALIGKVRRQRPRQPRKVGENFNGKALAIKV